MRMLCCICLLTALLSAAASAQGTSFNYQGKLELNGVPTTGVYDFRYTLFGSLAGANQIGLPIEQGDRAVSGGIYSTILDFGNIIFTGDARYLEIAVRPGASAGAYTVLAPRQQIVSSPYSTFAYNARGTGITAPLLMPGSSPASVAYGFVADVNTGMFSPAGNELGFATSGIERLRIDPGGDVSIGNTTLNGYKLRVTDSNHQIALEDADDQSFWTLSTVSGGGFGVYQSGATQRLAIASDGTVTVEGGKAVVYGNTGTEVMVQRGTATLTFSGGPNAFADGSLSFGNQGYSAPPQVFIGGFTPGPAGPGNFERFIVIPHSITTTGCSVRITNVSSANAAVTQGKWDVLIVGTR